MDALFASGQVMAFCGLAYGCYLCIVNWDVSDNSSVAREFRAGSGFQPRVARYELMGDPRVAGDTGFLV